MSHGLFEIGVYPARFGGNPRLSFPFPGQLSPWWRMRTSHGLPHQISQREEPNSDQQSLDHANSPSLALQLHRPANRGHEGEIVTHSAGLR
jgi:hypothetical protein